MTRKPPPHAIALLLGLTAFSAAAASGGSYRFEVFLDERPIGEHRFEVRQRGEQQQVSSRAEFEVRFLFLTAYSYRHRSEERFRDGCLERISARTDDNGTRYRIEGIRLGEDFRIERDGASRQIDGCIKTFAYWDPAILEYDRLLNPQTGELEPVRVNRRGADRVEFAGRKIPATRYALITDELSIDLWYSDRHGWVRLASDTDTGARLIYRRI